MPNSHSWKRWHRCRAKILSVLEEARQRRPEGEVVILFRGESEQGGDMKFFILIIK